MHFSNGSDHIYLIRVTYNHRKHKVGKFSLVNSVTDKRRFQIMDKVHSDKPEPKITFKNMKFHWILLTILITSLFVAHAYCSFDTGEVSSKFLTLNIYPQIEGKDIIWYNKSSASSYKQWVNALDDFTKVYRFPQYTPGRYNKTVKCDFNTAKPKDKVCEIDIDSWSPCTINENFNFEIYPCVFLQMSKDRYWKLETFKNVSELPEDMPESLVKYIKKKVEKEPNAIKAIWVSCDGKSPADRENIGEIKYFPIIAFPEYLFSDDKKEGYVHPVIAIELKGILNEIIVEIECKFWARNQHGSTSFEILIDN